MTRPPASPTPPPARRVRTRLLGAAAAALLVGTSGGWTPQSAALPAVDATPRLRGMAVGLYSDEQGDTYTQALLELRGLGVNAVLFLVQQVQENIRTTEIFPHPKLTPSPGRLAAAIRSAKRLGYQVFLMPTLFIKDLKPGEWRGTLQPPDWDRWFAEYRRFLLPYARLAEETGVDLFSVGSELCSTERHRQAWLALIRDVRAVYPGALLYSANWDHRHGVTFNDALDFLGVNAYFELQSDGDPSLETMRRRWRAIQREIARWQHRNGKPLIVTEVGYPSRDGAGHAPWDYTREAPVNPEAQALCYRAFRDAWAGVRYLDGVFFYIWHGPGGPDDRDYTPRGKPAAAVIRSWFAPDEPAGSNVLKPERKTEP